MTNKKPQKTHSVGSRKEVLILQLEVELRICISTKF